MVSRYKTLYFPNADHPLFPGRKWVGEHRIVLAEKLGRPLLSSEIAHHNDDNGRNNVPDNLTLKNWGEHSQLHNTGRKQSIETRAKRSATMKGKKKSLTHIENIRKAQIGKTLSQSTRQKLSAYWKDPVWRAKQIKAYKHGWRRKKT